MTHVRGFARHMAGIDERTEIPPVGLIPLKQRWRPPFLFTSSDITALLDEARAIQTGLRVTELTGLTCADLTLGPGAAVSCIGKGRRHRAVPLTAATAAVLKVWTAERAGQPGDPLFPTRIGNRLSADAVQRLVRRHAVSAAVACPSIRPGEIHPHVLRHSCAMTLLQAGVDTAVIALWLGYADIRSTHTYLHADMTIKQKALDRTTPATSPPGRFNLRQTACSHSSKPCNYADQTTPVMPRTPSSQPMPPHTGRHSSRLGIGR
ncbi:MAG: tyrosine-type recombinase/integrase [Acidimicrobiales bacterium]